MTTVNWHLRNKSHKAHEQANYIASFTFSFFPSHKERTHATKLANMIYNNLTRIKARLFGLIIKTISIEITFGKMCPVLSQEALVLDLFSVCYLSVLVTDQAKAFQVVRARA